MTVLNGKIGDIVKAISFSVSLLAMAFTIGITYANNQSDIKGLKTKVAVLEKDKEEHYGFKFQVRQNTEDMREIKKRTHDIQKMVVQILVILEKNPIPEALKGERSWGIE